MIRLFLSLIFACSAAGTAAQESSERPQYNFLVIVDTSASMAPRKPATVKLVRELISSGFHGQIEPGDSIDLWTYDSENRISGFPPQIWQTAASLRIAATAARFLDLHKFKNRGNFAAVASDLTALLPHSEYFLTVLVTDTEETISGISLDLEINEHLAKEKKRPGSKQPLLISISAIGGKFQEWTVFNGEGDLTLAELPKRPKLEPVVVVAEVQPEPQKEPEPEPLVVFNFPPGARVTPAPTPPPQPEPARVVAEAKSAELEPFEDAPPFNTIPNETPEEKQAEAIAAKVDAPDKTQKASNETTVAVANIKNETKSSPPQSTQPSVSPTKVVATEATTNIVLANAKPTPLQTIPGTNPPVTANNFTNATKAVAATSKPKNISGNSKEDIEVLAASAIPMTAIYASVGVGLACFGGGIFLLIRKFKRQAPSIISRSLQQ